jgi:hypothetical protein
MREPDENDYTTPGNAIAFSGITQLQRHNYKNVPEFLSTLDHYTRSRQAKSPRIYNPIFVYRLRELLQSDLIDMSSISKHNENTRFILILINTYSRYVWVRPLKSKHAEVVAKAFDEILSTIHPPFERLLTDAGKEYIGRAFQDMLRRHNLKHTIAYSVSKAATAERAGQTLKNLISNYLTYNETFRYLPQLDNLVLTYNSRPHRGIDHLSPSEAENPDNKVRVLNALNKKYESVLHSRPKHGPRFKVGDTVRLSIYSPLFKKASHEQFTKEFYKIRSVITRLPITQYEVATFDLSNNVKGRFYEAELQKTEFEVYKIEKVLKERKFRGRKQYFVKWLNFDDTHNTWIDEDQIVNQYTNADEDDTTESD